MKTASIRAYTMGLDDGSEDALETRGGHQVFMDALLFLVQLVKFLFQSLDVSSDVVVVAKVS